MFLRFREREECRKWLDRVSEQRAAGLAKAETYAELDWRLVSMLDRSPEGQYQIVGPVEARSTRSYDARARAQIRAMLAGGHAITDIKEERLDDHDRTERRVSGIAIRAIDQRGRLNLLARGFALNVAVMTGWMLRVIKWFGALALFPGAALFAASRFSAWSSLVARLDPVLAAELPRTELQALSRYVLTVLAALAWPLGVVLFLRRLRWPQLVGPAAVAVGALGTGPVLVLVGLGLGFSGIAARWGFPPWTVILMISLVSVTAVLGVVTGRGLRVVYVNNRSLARSLLEVDATRRVGPKRRAVGMTAWIVSVLYSGALAVSLTMWGAGILSGRGESFFYSMWRQAYDSLMLARAHAVDNPKAAEEDFERALSLWDALGKVCPHTPACTPAIQQSHAITYHDLASFQKRTRRLKEAEESLREAVKLDEELVRDFPGRAELRGQLEFHRDALSRLERLKEIRGRSGPIRDGLRQQPTGRAIRSKRVDAGPAAH